MTLYYYCHFAITIIIILPLLYIADIIYHYLAISRHFDIYDVIFRHFGYLFHFILIFFIAISCHMTFSYATLTFSFVYIIVIIISTITADAMMPVVSIIIIYRFYI